MRTEEFESERRVIAAVVLAIVVWLSAQHSGPEMPDDYPSACSRASPQNC